jgi:hypothetical protein
MSPTNYGVAEIPANGYQYCVTKDCKHKVPLASVVLDKCPKCGGDEYTTLERKKAIDRGVASAQSAKTPSLPDGATADPVV